MLDIPKLVKDIESVVLRTEVLLLEHRVTELELRQLGTAIIEDCLGFQIGD